MPPYPARLLRSSNWEEEEPSVDDKAGFKRALVLYIMENNLKDDTPAATMDTYKAVLPYLSNIVPKWNTVKTNELNPLKHKAHQSYMDTIRNTLKSRKQLKTLLLDYEKSLIEDEEEDESDHQAPDHSVTPGEPEAEVDTKEVDTPKPDAETPG